MNCYIRNPIRKAEELPERGKLRELLRVMSDVWRQLARQLVRNFRQSVLGLVCRTMVIAMVMPLLLFTLLGLALGFMSCFMHVKQLVKPKSRVCVSRLVAVGQRVGHHVPCGWEADQELLLCVASCVALSPAVRGDCACVSARAAATLSQKHI